MTIEIRESIGEVIINELIDCSFQGQSYLSGHIMLRGVVVCPHGVGEIPELPDQACC
jgi:hypothetical protein